MQHRGLDKIKNYSIQNNDVRVRKVICGLKQRAISALHGEGTNVAGREKTGRGGKGRKERVTHQKVLALRTQITNHANIGIVWGMRRESLTQRRGLC